MSLTSRNMFKKCTFTLNSDPETISNISRITSESFQSNFHMIFTFQDPQTINFQLKSKKVEKYARKLSGKTWPDVDIAKNEQRYVDLSPNDALMG